MTLSELIKNIIDGELNLNEGKLGDTKIEDLTTVIKNENIHTLDLRENNINTDRAISIILALKDTNVRSLYLDTNNIDNNYTKDVALALAKTNIHTFSLEHNLISDDGARNLISNLKNSKIHTLFLGCNEIAGAEDFAIGLIDTNINIFGLGHNKINPTGAEQLAISLKDSKVKSMNLRANKIGNRGARNLAAHLRYTNVNLLYLEGNEINDIGAENLIIALRNTKVHIFHLGYNLISDTGVKRLVAALKDTNICTLSLNGNKIGDGNPTNPFVGIHKNTTDLFTGLKNTNVSVIYFRNTEMNDDDIKNIIHSLEGTKVHTIDLGDNYISDTVVKSLPKILKKTNVTLIKGLLPTVEIREALLANLKKRKYYFMSIGRTAVNSPSLKKIPLDAFKKILSFLDNKTHDKEWEESISLSAYYDMKNRISSATTISHAWKEYKAKEKVLCFPKIQSHKKQKPTCNRIPEKLKLPRLYKI